MLSLWRLKTLSSQWLGPGKVVELELGLEELGSLSLGSELLLLVGIERATEELRSLASGLELLLSSVDAEWGADKLGTPPSGSEIPLSRGAGLDTEELGSLSSGSELLLSELGIEGSEDASCVLVEEYSSYQLDGSMPNGREPWRWSCGGVQTKLEGDADRLPTEGWSGCKPREPGSIGCVGAKRCFP
jgi:hypothetical protein